MRGWLLAAALVLGPAGEMVSGDDLDDIVKILQSAGKGPAHVAAGLAEAARGLTDKPLLRARLYERAYEYGLRDAEDCAVAIEAAQALVEARPAERAAWQDKLLGALEQDWKAAPPQRKAQAGARLMDCLLLTGDQRLREGEAEQAIRLYGLAFYKAPSCAPDRRGEAAERLRQARQRQQALTELDELTKALKAQPADAAARERMIRLLLVELGLAEEARKLLTADVAEIWRTYLPMTAKPLADLPPEACIELGNWYRELARTATPHGRSRMLSAGRDCYQRYLSLHGERDVAGLKAKVALSQVLAELKDLPAAMDLRMAAPAAGGTADPAPPAVGPPGDWVDALALAEEALAWGPGQWQKTAKGLHGTVANKSSSGFMLPLSAEGDFEVRMEYVLPDGTNAISVHVPLGRSASAVIILGYGGRTAGLWEVGGKRDPEKNGTGVPFVPVAGRSYQLRLSIAQDAAKATVAAQMDGKGLFTVVQPLSRFSKPRSDSGDLAVALSDGAVLVKSFQVRAVPGKGRLRQTGPVLKEIAPAGQWVDLLKLADKAREAAEGGKFTVTAQGVTVAAPKAGQGVVFPLRAVGDYEIRMEFTWTAGQSFVLQTMIDGAHKLPILYYEGKKGPGLGIWRFDEEGDIFKSPLTVPCVLSAGTWHQVHARVEWAGEEVKVEFTLDGKRLLAVRAPLMKYPTIHKRTNDYGVRINGDKTEIRIRRLEIRATSPAGRVVLAQDRP